MTAAPRSRAQRIAIACVFVIAATVLQLLRQRGQHPWDTIAPDDGTGYLQAAWSDHPVSLIWTQYAGYLQVGIRLVAAPLALLPLSWAARYLAVAGALSLSLMGLFVVRASEGLVRQPSLRWLLGLVLVLGPAVGLETSALISELQFPLFFAAFWAVLAVGGPRWFTLTRMVVVGLACLSNPIALSLIPLAVVVAVARRRRTEYAVTGALLVGALGQAITLLTVPTPPPLVPRTLDGVVGIYGQRVVAGTVVGEEWLQSAWLRHGSSLSVVSVMVVLALVLLFGATTVRSQWWYAAAALVWSCGILVFALYTRGLVPFLLARPDFFTHAGARYVLIPSWLLVSALVLLAGGHPRAVPAWLGR
ncbi:MAG: hypothetical protein MUP97_13520, partial [Acidimicrobiia bacterium]|nr:hypothetical protein [Acidimicrobiia bacterium]